MCARDPNPRWRCLALAAALLAFALPGKIWSQQAQPGRQADLTPQEIATIKEQIRQLDGRALIGFKPVDATRGMRLDGTPSVAPGEVARLAADLAPLGVRVNKQFRIIPAVAVVLDPERLEELLANPSVEYVEPDYLHEPTVQETPWGIVRVDAPAAWTYTRGAGVSVGIIDTGIDEDHPDLNPIGGINLITGGTTRADWDDNSSICPAHGTHVAGTVAALDNTIGVVGVAPEVDLYSLRVFDPENAGLGGCGALTNHIVDAIQWAFENGLDVVNMSLGSLFPAISLEYAMLAAYAGGVLPVAAAGNEYLSGQVGFPAGFPHAIAVAAIDGSDNVAPFSNTGPDVEVAAPGVSVLSTYGGGGYAYLNGTSMASPHAAGVAALVRAARPDLSLDQVRQVLRTTADDIGPLGFDWASGHGVVDAGAALDAVASSNLALSLSPDELTLAVEPGGSAITTTVQVSNVGAPGSISWSVTDDAAWLSASPTSGTTTGQFDVTADPTGLGTGFYTGYVTVSGNAANSPVTMRVRLAVGERISLDASVATAGFLPLGERLRYLVSGTEGQEIDVAVLADQSHASPLWDPVVRVYMPDGETLLAWNDDAPYAGLGFQSLVYRLVLPETGDYLVEVGGFSDAWEGGFLLKARPTGPIMYVYPYFPSYYPPDMVRAEQDGSPVQTTYWVSNLTGVGTMDWSLSCPDAWISCSPTTGTLSVTGEPVTASGLAAPERDPLPLPPGRPDPRADALTGQLQRTLFPDRRVSEAKLEELTSGALAAGSGSTRPAGISDPQITTQVTVTMDPSGLPLEANWGSLVFDPADNWLTSDFLVQPFLWVYSAGVSIAGDEFGYQYPWDMTTDDPSQADPPAIGTTFNDGGSLLRINSNATVGPPLVTGLGNPIGLTLGSDANWYASSWFSPEVTRITRDGVASPFATMPNNDFAGWLAWGPDGEIYATPWNAQNVFKINPDGSVEPFGPNLGTWGTGLAYRLDDNSLYVGLWPPATGVTVIPLDDPLNVQTIATNVSVGGVAVGESGKVYLSDFFDSGVHVLEPETSPQANRIAVSPASPYASSLLMGTALVEGGLAMSTYNFYGEFYHYPVSDAPLPPGGVSHLYTARFTPEEMITLAYPEIADPSAIHGEPFMIPQILYSEDGSSLPMTGFVDEVTWDPAHFTNYGMTVGDFGGLTVCNTDQTEQGFLACTAAREVPVDVPSVTLLFLDYLLDPTQPPGACLPLNKNLTELSGLAEDYLPQTDVRSPTGIGVYAWAFGDVTHDGAAGAADAVQILRHLVSLQLCPDCEIGLGDVDRDGAVTATDAVWILRWLVALQLPEHQRIGMHGLRECEVQ